jgi:hypothetical protein
MLHFLVKSGPRQMAGCQHAQAAQKCRRTIAGSQSIASHEKDFQNSGEFKQTS